MRRRALHLACILLLLASISSAEVAVVQAGGYGNHYISTLLRKSSAAPRAEAAPARSTRDKATTPRPGLLAQQDDLAVAPPVLQSAHVQAVTGSGL